MSESLSKATPGFVRTKLIPPIAKMFPRTSELRRGLKYLQTLKDKGKNYATILPGLTEEDREELFTDKILRKNLDPPEKVVEPYFESTKKHDFYNQVLLLEIKTYLPDDLIEIIERQSMAHGIESRIPFYDHCITEFAFTVPSNLKIRGSVGKYILRKAISGMVPKRVLQKKKQGFSINAYTWFKKELRTLASQILSERTIQKREYFKHDFIKRILEHPPTPKLNKYYAHIWNLTAFEIWHRIYIDSENVYKPRLSIKNFV